MAKLYSGSRRKIWLPLLHILFQVIVWMPLHQGAGATVHRVGSPNKALADRQVQIALRLDRAAHQNTVGSPFATDATDNHRLDPRSTRPQGRQQETLGMAGDHRAGAIKHLNSIEFHANMSGRAAAYILHHDAQRHPAGAIEHVLPTVLQSDRRYNGAWLPSLDKFLDGQMGSPLLLDQAVGRNRQAVMGNFIRLLGLGNSKSGKTNPIASRTNAFMRDSDRPERKSDTRYHEYGLGKGKPCLVRRPLGNPGGRICGCPLSTQIAVFGPFCILAGALIIWGLIYQHRLLAWDDDPLPWLRRSLFYQISGFLVIALASYELWP